MDNFYIIKPAVDTEETGHVFPAVEVYENYNFKGENSMHNLNHREFPDFEPELRFKLAKGAKLCDVLGQTAISASGLLVSEKLKTILDGTSIVPHAFYPASIEVKGEFYLYYWMHLVWQDGIEHLDFPKSKFKVKKVSRDLGEVQIKDYEDLLVKQGELGFIKMIYNYNYVFNNVNFDMFLHPLNKTIFVNQRVFDLIMDSKLTGVSFQSSDNLIMS